MLDGSTCAEAVTPMTKISIAECSGDSWLSGIGYAELFGRKCVISAQEGTNGAAHTKGWGRGYDY
jgi:hypothetical protein